MPKDKGWNVPMWANYGHSLLQLIYFWMILYRMFAKDWSSFMTIAAVPPPFSATSGFASGWWNKSGSRKRAYLRSQNTLMFAIGSHFPVLLGKRFRNCVYCYHTFLNINVNCRLFLKDTRLFILTNANFACTAQGPRATNFLPHFLSLRFIQTHLSLHS